MRDSLRRRCALLAAVLLASAAPAFAEGKTVRTESWKMENRNEVFAWIPERLPAEPVPMVLALNCTNGNPQAEVKTNGWDALCAEENFIVIAPEYRDNASYEDIRRCLPGFRQPDGWWKREIQRDCRCRSRC